MGDIIVPQMSKLHPPSGTDILQHLYSAVTESNIYRKNVLPVLAGWFILHKPAARVRFGILRLLPAIRFWKKNWAVGTELYIHC